MDTMQLVIFRLDDQEYGVNIFNVNEIVPYALPTKIPNLPVYIEGVLNLRGSVIPVINLRKKFNLEDSAVNDRTRIIVSNNEGKTAGFVVDEASEVLTIDKDSIEQVSDVVSNISRRYIEGIGKKEGGEMFILLNIKELYSE
ncbi:MAG: purine-binding chemotaxis protein CheW [Gracilibacteraceae bacterium]|nr:purine-binding chemotaxis protein CheW [Gracilibacteraceae bacterium]